MQNAEGESKNDSWPVAVVLAVAKRTLERELIRSACGRFHKEFLQTKYDGRNKM